MTRSINRLSWVNYGLAGQPENDTLFNRVSRVRPDFDPNLFMINPNPLFSCRFRVVLSCRYSNCHPYSRPRIMSRINDCTRTKTKSEPSRKGRPVRYWILDVHLDRGLRPIFIEIEGRLKPRSRVKIVLATKLRTH
ncbi:hypothetical protein L484_004672 [Morus notabilis]|uniref:Uncharacterized protein n=1 Tax=Morus notabilis TaxID=981085 RepID=W9RUU6_9ROSA|nr:hypothetical protein L484_004672 [Morus notabilis]